MKECAHIRCLSGANYMPRATIYILNGAGSSGIIPAGWQEVANAISIAVTSVA